MAQPSNDQLAKSLLDSSRREVVWPVVFAGVKNVVRSNNLNSDTLACIKGWLKSSDSQLHIPLLSLTVLHTMSLNSSVIVRNQIAAPKLFQRLEKQLAKPQGPQVASAIIQVLVDWAHLFGHEELGARCRAVLQQPRYVQMAAGCSPSEAVTAMGEEMRLGIPPVAPIRGEDFIRWMYRGASIDGLGRTSASPGAGGAASIAPGLSPAQQAVAMGLPGGAPPPITSTAVPQLCQRMAADAQRLSACLITCRAGCRATGSGAGAGMSQLVGAMDAGYREAERCSQWRRRVQDFTQRSDDPAAMSSVLAATDVINTALQNWQHFTSLEVYHSMRITVPTMPPEPAPGTSSTSYTAAQRQQPGAAARPQQQHAGPSIDDLLGMGGGAIAAPQQPDRLSHPQPQPQFDPFGVGAPAPPPSRSAGSSSSTAAAAAAGASANPFAAAISAAATPPPIAASGAGPGSAAAAAATAASSTPANHRTHPSLSDWDPFGPPAFSNTSATAASQYPMQRLLPQPAAPAAIVTSIAAGAARPVAPGSAFAANVNSWAVFGDDTTHGSGPISCTVPHSPAVSFTTSHASGVLPSPASVTSVSSTPNGPAGGSASAAFNSGGLPSPPPMRLPADPPPRVAATPQTATTTAVPGARSVVSGLSGVSSAVSSPQLYANGIHRPDTAGAAAVTALTRSATTPVSAAASTTATATSTAAPAAGATTGAAGATRATNAGAGGIAAATAALDWRPEFERLASELRSMAAASTVGGQPQQQGSSNGNGGGGQVPVAAALGRVQALCEALAAQHARQVAALEAQHAVEVRDVKSKALVKLREVMTMPHQQQQQQQAQAQAQVQGSAVKGAAMVPGAGGMAAASGNGGNGGHLNAAGQGPLQQGLQQQQHQQYAAQGMWAQQQHKANGQAPAFAVTAGGGSNGAGRASVPLDFSLI